MSPNQNSAFHDLRDSNLSISWWLLSILRCPPKWLPPKEAVASSWSLSFWVILGIPKPTGGACHWGLLSTLPMPAFTVVSTCLTGANVECQTPCAFSTRFTTQHDHNLVTLSAFQAQTDSPPFLFFFFFLIFKGSFLYAGMCRRLIVTWYYVFIFF